MASFDAKRISDAVHGTIGLSSLELDVVSSPAFQRLRNVKQLGLAHLVYPGADYSRFSHSLGVCHITGRILESLRDKAGVENIVPAEIQRYRLAALLHDVGHYPFSHAMEHAIQNHYTGQLYQPKNNELFPDTVNAAAPEGFFLHERVSREILDSDPQLHSIFQRYEIDPKDIYSNILRTKPERFTNLISSDLDADRMDYLLRSAHHTGLPYGNVDLDYLVSQLRVDKEGHICLTQKALRAADHLLLARYFDYQQINFHKTVASLELLLKDVLGLLFSEGVLQCSADDIQRKVKEGEWQSFDDTSILSAMRKFFESSTDTIAKQKTGALLARLPPRLVVDYEKLGDRNSKNEFKRDKRLVREHIKGWASRFGIDESLWYLWDISMPLTKIGSRVPSSSAYEYDPHDPDNYEQAVRVLDKDGKGSKLLSELPYSLMSVLSNHALYSLRVYVLLQSDQESLRKEIRSAIKQDLQEIEWK